MPDGKELKYPGIKAKVKLLSFPSLFTEKDAETFSKKQEDVLQYRERLQEFQGYPSRPLPERMAREVGSWLPLEKLPMPAVKYGLTPTETTELSILATKETDELQRKRRVSAQADSLTSMLNALHNAEVPIQSEGELEPLIALSRNSDWLIEDRAWLIDYARQLFFQPTEEEVETPSGMEAEDIFKEPVSPETFFGKSPTEQRFIGSTVALSKNIGEVTKALKSMYEAVPPPLDKRTQELRDLIKKAYEGEELPYDEDKSPEDNLVLLGDYQSQETDEEKKAWVEENNPNFFIEVFKKSTGYMFPPLKSLADIAKTAGEFLEKIDTPFMMRWQANHLGISILHEGYEPTLEEQHFLKLYEEHTGDSALDLAEKDILSWEHRRKFATTPLWETFWGNAPMNPSRELIESYYNSTSLITQLGESLTTPLALALLAIPAGIGGKLSTQALKFGAREGFQGFLGKAAAFGLKPFLMTQGAINKIVEFPFKMIGKGIKKLTMRGAASKTTEQELLKMGIDPLSKEAELIRLVNEAIVKNVEKPLGKELSPQDQMILYTEATHKALENEFGKSFADAHTDNWVKSFTNNLREESEKLLRGDTLREDMIKVSEGLSEDTRIALNELVEKAIQQGCKESDITAIWVAKNIKKGTSLPKSEGLVNSLKEVGEGATKLSPDETWAKFIRNRVSRDFVLGEENLAVKSILQTERWAVISAERAELSVEVNASRTAALQRHLGSEGREFYTGKGVYRTGDKLEDVFFIRDIKEVDAVRLGKFFPENPQESIMTNRGLIFLEDETYLKGNLTKISMNQGEKEYFTLLKLPEGKGVKFTVPLGEERILLPKSELVLTRPEMITLLKEKYHIDIEVHPEKILKDSMFRDTKRGGRYIELGTKNITEYPEADRTILENLIMLHEVGHSLDPLVKVKGVDALTKEVEAWKFAITKASEFGMNQQDVLRVARDFIPTLHPDLGEGKIFDTLVEKGLLTPKASLEKTIPTGEELIKYSGIPKQVPEGMSPITGLPSELKGAKIPLSRVEGGIKIPFLPEIESLSSSMKFPVQTNLRRAFEQAKTKKYWFMGMARRFQEPFYQLYTKAELTAAKVEAIHTRIMDEIYKNPRFKSLLGNEEALGRVRMELQARNPRIVAETGLEHPILSAPEMELANTIESILKGKELEVRYLRLATLFDEHSGNVKKILKNIPDAKGFEDEITKATGLYGEGKERELLEFLVDKTWGTISSGYTPEQVFYPNILRGHLTGYETIGYGLLQTRERVAIPEATVNIVKSLDTYIRKLDTRFFLRPIGKEGNGLIQKLKATKTISEQELKDITDVTGGFFDDIVHYRADKESIYYSGAMSVVGQAYRTVFDTYPHLFVRNMMQPYMFHPDRLSILKYLKTPMNEIEKLFFNADVTQMKGIKGSLLLQEETRGINFLKPFNRLAERLSMYAHSDTWGRYSSFHASYNRAIQANKKFLESGKATKDFNTWLKDSSVWHLEREQRDVAYQYLVGGKTSFGIPGLSNLSGEEAAALYIGKEITDITHFLYTRAMRGYYEHGTIGKIFFGLTTFPKSYAERMSLQFMKTFDKELPWSLRRKGLQDVIAMCVVGELGTRAYEKVTGRTTKSYSPLHMFNWTVGGMVMGVLYDLSEAVYVLQQAAFGDKERQNVFLAKLASQAAGIGRTFIPWYQQSIFIFEAAAKQDPYIDAAFIRKCLGMIKENYTPQEIEQAERSLWETWQHALTGGKGEDPTLFEQEQEKLFDATKELGSYDENGNLLDLSTFAAKVRAGEKKLPSGVISEDYQFDKLSCFYVDSENYLRVYYEEPYTDYESTAASKMRRDERIENPNIDALLYFWGKTDKLLTPRAEEIVEALYDAFDIPVGIRR